MQALPSALGNGPAKGNHHNGTNGSSPEWLRKKALFLALAALGVVYGDIGTSPLYTIRECFYGKHSIILTQDNVLGVISLVFWSLTVVICIKYVTFILRANNRGEGGIFALLGLIPTDKGRMSPRLRWGILIAGILGAGLLYGDGIITPAISVLSAIEGLEVATKAAKPLIVPLTCLVLFFLFLVQRRGTADIGKVFGPIMLLWFATIAALGLGEIVQTPQILKAIHPGYAFHFFVANRLHGIVVLGSVVLCLTGGEALYADLGHFGRKAIHLSWFGLAYPALLLNYFGQGALVLQHSEPAFNPFYGLAPKVLLYPMVGLSTIATVIASQALISGVFSLTQQAVRLGFCPRLHIVHTSHEVQGQIYIPSVNFALMLACIGVVIGFGGSGGLAGAYGIAVTGTMTITSILYFLVITYSWRWPLWKTIPLVTLFLGFDLAYFGGNLMKVVDGGWFTILAAVSIMILMTTWRKGRQELGRRLLGARLPIDYFLDDLSKHSLPRVPGTAVFMSVSPSGTPATLLHHVKHNHMLHETIVLLSIQPADVPIVPRNERVQVEALGQGFYRILARNGFMQTPDVPGLLKIAEASGLAIDPAMTSYYLGRETLRTTGDAKMMRWRKALFAFMARNAGSPAAYFRIPVNRVVELGAQIEL
jgi:KUP system potassium uptake protein